MDDQEASKTEKSLSDNFRKQFNIFAMSNLHNFNVDPVDRLLCEDGMEILEDELRSPVFKENNGLCSILPDFLRSGKKVRIIGGRMYSIFS